jgi:four helix bundle protein
MKMEKTNFEKLDVYKLSEQLSDVIWDIVIEWDYFVKDTIGKQLVKSADSIGANIAEGSGRGTDKDNIHFIKISRGSLYETQHWLRRAYKRKLITEKNIKQLLPTIITNN